MRGAFVPTRVEECCSCFDDPLPLVPRVAKLGPMGGKSGSPRGTSHFSTLSGPTRVMIFLISSFGKVLQDRYSYYCFVFPTLDSLSGGPLYPIGKTFSPASRFRPGSRLATVALGMGIYLAALEAYRLASNHIRPLRCPQQWNPSTVSEAP